MVVWAIIQNNAHILLIQRSHQTTRPDQWCFPGGGIKNDEAPEQACIREVKEETQLSIEILDRVASSNGDYYFCCQLTNSHESIHLKRNECKDFAWIEPINLTDVGIIMNLRVIVPILRSMGYGINLTHELEEYIN